MEEHGASGDVVDLRTGAPVAPRPVRDVVDAGGTELEIDRELAEAFARFAMEVLGDPGSIGELHLRSIAGVLPIVVWAVDGDMRFTACFGGGQRRIGLEDDVLVGASVDVFGPLGVEAVRQVIADGEPHTFMATGGDDGEPWQYWNLVMPLGDTGHAVAISLDTTDQYVAARKAEAHSRLNRNVAEALRDSEERFRLLATEAPIGIFVLGPDAGLLYANPQVREQAGRTLEELIRHGAEEAIFPEDRDAFREALRRLFDKREPMMGEYRLTQPDGSVRWVRVRASLLLDEQGEPAGAVGSSADVTDHRLAEQRLAEREERLRLIVETAAEGIVSTDEAGMILEFNAAAERIFGVDSDQVIGRWHFTDIVAPEVREALTDQLAEYLDGAAPKIIGAGPQELPGVRADGTVIPLELSVSEVMTSEGRLFTGMLRDISERLEFEHQLEHMATHDPTTGLANRVLFSAQLEDAIERADRARQSVAVLLVEVERLAQVIESLGHEAGDELIRQAAARIEHAIEAPDAFATLARIGTAEFAVFVEGLADPTDTVEYATAIVEAMNAPFELADDEAFVDAAIGIATSADRAGGAEALIANAALAMGRARQVSATRYEVFDEHMRGAVEQRRKTELALRRGRERDELELHYQPVIDLATRRVCGVEALIRWNHPERGLVTPNEFIPVAEDSGLIVPIGAWVVDEACAQLAKWQDQGLPELCVSINLSARQLAEPDLAQMVIEALEASGASPSCVTFELTETMLLADAAQAKRALLRLKDSGVRIALDDFGTGYSSLTYLLDFPIDVVKVDRSFVHHVGESSRDRSIVASIVSLASTLGLEVVAEGVETAEQAAALLELGCVHAQGFLFARPQPAAALEALLRETDRTW